MYTLTHNMLYYRKKIASWLLPYSCLLCSNPCQSISICQPCLREFPKSTRGCVKCAIPLSFDSIKLLCGQCLKKPPFFEKVYSIFLYEMPVIKLILNLKFNHVLYIAETIGKLIAAEIKTWYKETPLPELIIPVPLHLQRIKERGFNQALEIARPIAKIIKRPIDAKSCSRIKITLPQATLSATKRKLNIQNAFSVTSNFQGLHLALVDDVVTTGHTINEVCKSLKAKGAQRIDVWCAARAPI